MLQEEAHHPVVVRVILRKLYICGIVGIRLSAEISAADVNERNLSPVFTVRVSDVLAFSGNAGGS